MNNQLHTIIIFSIIGFFSGSILYAKLLPKLFYNIDITEISEDGNPGTANVFKYCGKKCGILTAILEFAKGFFPVAFSHGVAGINMTGGFAFLVLISPVLGHMFSIFNNLNGGIGIAPLFGTLIAIYPFTTLLVALVLFYSISKFVLKLRDHRTFFVFFCFGIYTLLFEQIAVVKCTYAILSALIIGKKQMHSPNSKWLQVG